MKCVPRARTAVFALLVSCATVAAQSPGDVGNVSPSLLPEFRQIGALGNNLVHPELNPVAGTPERALAPLNFAPGTRNGLIAGPNPRLISNVISGGMGASGQDSGTDDPLATGWLYVFGQFVDHDLDLEHAPPDGESISVVVPPGDPVLPAGTAIVMNRDLRDPQTNTVINTVAGFLDLSQLYGSTQAVADSLRNPDGSLKSSADGQSLSITNGVFITGDPRVMENPQLTAVTTLFMREHNQWVKRLRAQNPQWTGDQLYNMARTLTVAGYQNIVYKDFLPALIGPVIGPYRGYDPNVNAQVSQEFSAAAFRVGHTQVSGEQVGIDNAGNELFSQSLDDAFFNTPEEDLAHGLDPLMRFLSKETALATDVYVVPILRNLLFTPLVGGNIDAIDLIAIDIQRGRDAGLASLNQTRAALGMPAYASVAELTSDPMLQKDLQAVYGSINNIDLFMGGLAEQPAPGAAIGPTFQAIIRDQFEAIRSGDRFHWENIGFDPATKQLIANTRLSSVIRRNTDTTDTQENLFVLEAGRNAAPPEPVREGVARRIMIVDPEARQRNPFLGR